MLNKLLKSNISYTYFGNLFISALSFIRNILIAKLINFDTYNNWVLVNTQTQYANNADLGINNGALIKSLEKQGTNENNKINEIITSTFAFITLQLVIFIILISIFFDYISSTPYIKLIIIFSLIVNTYTNYIALLLRLDDKFKELIFCQFFSVLFSIILILFTWKIKFIEFNYISISYSIFIGLSLGFAYSILKNIKFFKFSLFSNKIIYSLLRKGSVLTINSFIFLMLLTLDRFFINNYFDENVVNIFNFASVFSVSLFMIPNSISNVIINKSLRDFNKLNKKILINTIFIIGIIFLILNFFIIIGFNIVILNFLPIFTESKNIFSIILSSLSLLFFFNISQILSIGENILNKTVLLNLFLIIIKFLSIYFLLDHGYITTINSFCYFSLFYNLILCLIFFITQNIFSNNFIYDSKFIYNLTYIIFSMIFLSLMFSYNIIFVLLNLINILFICFLYYSKTIILIKKILVSY